MKKRTLISIALLIALLSSLYIPAMASTRDSTVSSVPFDLQEGFDTLDYTQQDYLPSRVSTRAQAADDSSQIEQLIVGFLASSKAYVRSPEHYSIQGLAPIQ